jgi:threonine dehydrogenase-like Zn-dependent dehydrogenase
MQAVCWYGKRDVRVDNVPEPVLLNRHDAIVKITLTAICGSDLHLYNGLIPTMQKGDILGHEFMGEVVEVGSSVKKLKIGDRVVVPFTICCGECFFCKNQMWSLCDNTNPNAGRQEMIQGQPTAGLFGYAHLNGGFAGGQAQYARVPFADVGPLQVTNGVSDEQALFLSDIFPTAWMAVENCSLPPGGTVAIWGCGPVGLLAAKSAWLLGARRVIALDHIPERLEMARAGAKAEALDYSDVDVVEKLKYMTGGRGPDACIDAVGMEAHGMAVDAIYDRARQAAMLETDRSHALRQAIQACRKGGTVSIPGVYAGTVDKFPLGMAFAKGLTFKMGQTHVPKYMAALYERVKKGDIDPSFIITHRLRLDEAPQGYRTFHQKKEHCIKVVLYPH